MKRRTFLEMAAASGLLRASALDAGEACVPGDGALCPVPFRLDQFPANPSKPEWADSKIERPLWSQLLRPGNTQLNEVLADLQKAYERIAKYDAADPRSLFYQSSLHRYYCGHEPGGQLPETVRGIHDNWAFLPWHRAFLYFHERLLQSESGNRKFRLPVWDWEAADGFHVPAVYRALGPIQTCTCERNTEVAPIHPCLLKGWLECDFQTFVGTTTNPPLSQAGPHSSVHVQLGGYMSSLETAAADPLFYSHHANIDRFWVHWARRHGDSLPGDQASKKFYFYDFPMNKTPVPVEVTAGELQDTSKLGYTYRQPGLRFMGVTIVSGGPGNADKMWALESAAADKFSGWLQRYLPFLPVKQIRDLLRKGAKTAPMIVLGILAMAEELMLPVRIKMKVPVVEKGRFYLVGIIGPGRPFDEAVIIGGFGAFTAHTSDSIVSAVGCFQPRDLIRFWEILLMKGNGFQVVCGPVKTDFWDTHPDAVTAIEDGRLVVVSPIAFEILLPKI